MWHYYQLISLFAPRNCPMLSTIKLRFFDFLCLPPNLVNNKKIGEILMASKSKGFSLDKVAGSGDDELRGSLRKLLHIISTPKKQVSI